MRWPHVVNRWLRNKELRDLLRAIATGELPLSHETFMTISPSPSGDHLRDLLVDQGLLDPRHRELLRFEHWATYQTGQVEPADDRKLITTYATWHHHRRLARDVDTGKLTPTATKVARQQIQAAITLLGWLRVQHATTLADCQQSDIDRWFASGTATRQHAARFLTWARQQRLCPEIRVPAFRAGGADAIPDDQRAALVARLLHDPTLELADRVAGLLVVLYAQPATRLTRLRLEAVTIADDQTTLRLGTDDIVLPEPIGQLVAQLVQKRRSDHAAGWLFPGRIPGQPIRPSSLRNRLNALGVTRASRIGAFHHLAQNVPAPVLADLIGYNPVFTAEQSTVLATGWNTYAALRSRPPARP